MSILQAVQHVIEGLFRMDVTLGSGLQQSHEMGSIEAKSSADGGLQVWYMALALLHHFLITAIFRIFEF